jgi:hypothetical protein
MAMLEHDSETTRIARAYVDSLEERLSAVESQEPPAVESGSHRGAPAPDPIPYLAGRRLMSSIDSEIYIVDRGGYRRRIADHATYVRLFRDWSGIMETDVDRVALGEPIGSGTVLVRGDNSSSIYIIDQGRRRLITSIAVMEKYWFNWERISVMDQSILESIAVDADWE